MTKDQLLTKLRSGRDKAAAAGDHGEALMLNDRIQGLKQGGSITVERVMQQFESALANRPRPDEITEGHPIWEAIDLGGGQTCDVAGVLRKLHDAGFSIVSQSNLARGKLDPAIISELLDLLNPLHGAIDRQTARQFLDEDELGAPDDREYDVNITARMERDLTQAVCILERRLRDFNPPLGA